MFLMAILFFKRMVEIFKASINVSILLLLVQYWLLTTHEQFQLHKTVGVKHNIFPPNLTPSGPPNLDPHWSVLALFSNYYIDFPLIYPSIYLFTPRPFIFSFQYHAPYLDELGIFQTTTLYVAVAPQQHIRKESLIQSDQDLSYEPGLFTLDFKNSPNPLILLAKQSIPQRLFFPEILLSQTYYTLAFVSYTIINF